MGAGPGERCGSWKYDYDKLEEPPMREGRQDRIPPLWCHIASVMSSSSILPAWLASWMSTSGHFILMIGVAAFTMDPGR